MCVCEYMYIYIGIICVYKLICVILFIRLLGKGVNNLSVFFIGGGD